MTAPTPRDHCPDCSAWQYKDDFGNPMTCTCCAIVEKHREREKVLALALRTSIEWMDPFMTKRMKIPPEQSWEDFVLEDLAILRAGLAAAAEVEQS